MKALETAKNAISRSDTHAIKLLMGDHREVEALFKQFEASSDKTRQVSLLSEICLALTVHTQIEEQLFYPQSRKVLKQDQEDMVDEAVVEHATLKDLMSALRGMRATHPLFKAHATVLKEYIQHHVKEEESEYFPQVDKTSLDLEALGAQMHTLKQRLMKQLKPGRSSGATVSVPALTQKSAAPASRKTAVKADKGAAKPRARRRPAAKRGAATKRATSSR